jgi:hypothetical protein
VATQAARDGRGYPPEVPKALMVGTRSLTLDIFEDPPSRSQAPEFKEVINSHADDPAFLELREIAKRLAVDRGDRGFTVEDLRAECHGFGAYRRNLPGIVLGSLRSMHAICVIGRERSTHPAGRGRWVNRFKLNGEALRIDV